LTRDESINRKDNGKGCDVDEENNVGMTFEGKREKVVTYFCDP